MGLLLLNGVDDEGEVVMDEVHQWWCWWGTIAVKNGAEGPPLCDWTFTYTIPQSAGNALCARSTRTD